MTNSTDKRPDPGISTKLPVTVQASLDALYDYLYPETGHVAGQYAAKFSQALSDFGSFVVAVNRTVGA